MYKPTVRSLSHLTPKDFSRRLLLRGAGGAALGMPLLELTANRARAQMTPPKRVLFMTVGHSVDPYGETGRLPAFNSAVEHGAALPGNISEILAPLALNRARLLVINGINNAAFYLQGSNGHDGTSRSLLSPMPMQGSLDGAGNLLASPPICDYDSDPAGPSIEHFLADAWDEALLSLRVGGDPGPHVRSFRMDLSRDLHEGNPNTAFTRLFRPSGSGTLSPLDRLRGKRGSILDAVSDNFARLAGRVGRADRVRLERHAAQLRELELSLREVTRIVCDNPQFAPPQSLSGANFNDPNGRTDDRIAAAQVELVKMAFACQATRVAHIHFSNISENKFPFLNGGVDMFPVGWHGVIHRSDGTDAQRVQTMSWYSKVLNDTIESFVATPDGDGGTLMDSTLIVWMSSLGTSAHSPTPPIVLAGDLGGRLRTGRFLRYSRRSTGDFFTTLLNLLDVPAQSFGWTRGETYGTPLFTGPLSGFTG